MRNPFCCSQPKQSSAKRCWLLLGFPLVRGAGLAWLIVTSPNVQCGVSSAQHLSTNKDFILHNLQCQKVGCPSQLQVSSSLGKVNLCQSKRAGVDHCVESLFHPGPCRRHASQPSFQTAEEFHLLRHPTIRALKVQCTGRGLFPF